jgi:glucosamine--fructose-6-phosphate aminotransferase (isomerizing)
MQKEIYEQPNAIKNTLTGRISHGEVDLSELGANANELLARLSIFRSLPAAPPTTPVWFLATGLNRWRRTVRCGNRL